MSQPTNFVKLLSPIAMAIILSACGGSSGSNFGSGTDTTDTDTTDTDTTDTGIAEAEELVYSLQPLEIGLTTLTAGGSTGITTRLIDQNDDFAQVEQTLSFTSPCISEGTSEIVSPITSSNGVFTTTYTAKGCEGEDEIKATVGGLSESETVTVQGAELGAVEFVSALPSTILLEGMSAPGLQHTSTVTFQIKNNAGGPFANADVAFELVTSAAGDGGISLASAIGKTDNDGFVSTILHSGTVHTTVRVRATVIDTNGEEKSSESSQVVISTGIADQNSMSLSFETLNPAAWEYDGVDVSVNLRASDRYNNPVADGTTVAFYTELGQIDPSCQTVDGACSVIWTSSDPRDLGVTDGRYPRDVSTFNSDGITTITAKMIGEESFLDSNANGIFDDGDQFDSLSDRGEAYADYNINYDLDGDGITDNQFDQGLDRFILDYNGNGSYDAKDGKYTGLGCEHSTLCADGNGLKDVFTFGEIVMSEDNQDIKVWRWNNGVKELVRDSETGVNLPLTVGMSYQIETFGVVNKQIPPVGTTINVTSEEAEVNSSGVIVASSNYHGNDVLKPYGPYSSSFSLSLDGVYTGLVDIVVSTALTSTFGLAFDALAPTVELNGEQSLYFTETGLTYVEQGATASDNYGLTASNLVMGGDTVDTNTEGVYKVTYTAEDLAGNSTTNTRTVIVDATPPTITLNGSDTVQLALGALYKENGAIVEDNISINQDDLVISGTVDTLVPGTYTITYNVHDAAGHPATEVVRSVVVNP